MFFQSLSKRIKSFTQKPNVQKKFFPTEASEEFVEKGYLKDAGKQIPFIEKVIVNILVEDQPRWLNFQKGNIDYLGVPKDNFTSAVTPNNQVSKEFESKGISLEVRPSLDVTYTAFNHDNKLFHNVKLRRAMALAYDVVKGNELFYNNKALPAQSIVPPGIKGHISGYESPFRKRN